MSSNKTTIGELTTDVRPYSFMIPFIIQTIFNTFIFVGGLIGNLFVIVIILRRKKMQTLTNWFVFNLAISNVCIVILTIPIGILMPQISWPLGKIGCVIIIPILEHFAGVCVLTHTALSLVRCLIVNSAISGYRITVAVVRYIIILIWVIAFTLMSLPLMTGFIARMKTRKGRNEWTGHMTNQCFLTWVSTEKEVVYRIYIFLLTYIIPMIITGISYVWIHVAVANSIKHLYGHMSEQMLTTRRRKSQHMDRILVIIYILFAISTLPLQLVYLSSLVLPKKFSETDFGENFLLGLQALFYTQVVWNPLVLFFMGEEYRKEIYNLPLCRCLNSNNKNISYSVRGSFRGVLNVYRKRKSIDNQRRRSSAKNSTKKSLTDRIASPNKSKNDSVYNSLAQIRNNEEKEGNLYTAQCIPPQMNDTSGSPDVQPLSNGLDSSSVEPFLDFQNISSNGTSLHNSSTLYCSSNIGPTTDNILETPKTCITSQNLTPKEVCCQNLVTKFTDDVFKTTSINDVELKPASKTNLLSSDFTIANGSIPSAVGTLPSDNTKYSELEMYSDKLPSAYYDDGTLMFFHDSTFGKVYLQCDDGRETDL